MACVAAPLFQRPEPGLPRLDLKPVLAQHQANLIVVQEAQAVLLGAAQAIARLQAGHAQTLITRARGALATREPGKPEAVLAEVKAAAETALATVQQSLDLGLAAQRRVVELVAARARADLERSTTRAA